MREATSGVGGRGSIVEKGKEKSPDAGERNIAPSEREDVNANANVDPGEEGAQCSAKSVRLEPHFSEWLLPGEKRINSLSPIFLSP